jgi:hypothetical protein
VLINLNEAEVKFALYSIHEMAAKLESKLTSEAKTGAILDLLKPTNVSTVRLTKAGRPAKKPGRKPGKKPVVKQPEQQAA